MLHAFKAAVMCCAIISLFGCTSLENIHDPRVGTVSRESLPGLIKSIRCELETFYTANESRRRYLVSERIALAKAGKKTIGLKEVLDHRYFDLDSEAYGAFTLDLKIQDTFGIPGISTSLPNLVHSTTGHSKTLGLGPSIQSVGTYQGVLWFSIGQNQSVVDPSLRYADYNVSTTIPEDGRRGNPDVLECYRFTVSAHDDDLAKGLYAQAELFDRIKVDGSLPLAAWLMDNSNVAGISRNILMDSHAKSEKVPRTPIPVDNKYLSLPIDNGQLTFVFTIQNTGSLDAKFSLVSSRWNPLVADMSASVQQTSILSVYVNGYGAVAAIAARQGLQAITPTDKPSQVLVVNGTGVYPELRVATTAEQVAQRKQAVDDLLSGADVSEESKKNFLQQFDILSKDPGGKRGVLNLLSELRNRQGMPIHPGLQRQIEKHIEDVAAPKPAVPAPIQRGNNDGRGYLRYPLALPPP
jgi:hypothetical protein